ncbi:membrane protein YczE [Microbacterium mangrovi]|uniref:membrane protein YczE n=1 Tax=Microbacterium mangrovi TaxID=1348253 RepID=UPI00068CED32|nr:membrane protein [Microbacterium mangrovi]
MVRRVVQLIVGLALYGAGDGVMIRAGFGVDPWTVFAQGLSVHTGIGVGWITNIVGLLVLLLWIPLRQKPGIGTVANILLVGTAMQLTIAVLPPADSLALRIAFLVAGILLVAVASGLYIGAHFGPGPRDGLMIGMHARLGWPIWVCRGTVEITVLVVGWALGGTVGIGTLAFAFGIGPLVGITLPLFDTRRPSRALRTEVPTAVVER